MKRYILANLEMECQAEPSNQQLSQRRNSTRAELNELIAQENIYWHQRAKVSWFQEGDRNSKFFHVVASQRRRHNEITKLKDSSRNFYSNQTNLERIVVDYFQEMFTSVSTRSYSQVIHYVHEVITPEMNNMLLEEFTQDEVKKVLF